MIFAVFASYVDRRNFDTALKSTSSNNLSYEYMYYAFEGARDQLENLRDQRCAERDALTFYRLSTFRLREAYSEAYQIGLGLRAAIRQFINERKDKLDLSKMETTLNNSWGILLAGELIFRAEVGDADRKQIGDELNHTEEDLITKANEQLRADPSLYQLVQQISDDLKADPFDALKQLAQQSLDSSSHIFDLSAVSAFEQQLQRLNEASLQALWNKDDPISHIFIQRLLLDNVARGTDLQGAAKIASEVFNPARGTANANLANLDCSPAYTRAIEAAHKFFDQYVRPGLIQTLLPEISKPDHAETRLGDAMDSAWQHISQKAGQDPVSFKAGYLSWFSRANVWLLSQSTTLQTLLVTVLFGVAGALCLNALRLSRRGVWKTVEDPGWGEILLSIVLGGSAALVVFLLATLGLIVVSDGQSRGGDFTTVGASLVGVLGFVSGLLNESAFGRIVFVGQQFFGQTADGRQEDDELVRTLKQLGCTRFAQLAAIFDLAPQYSAGSVPQTLFVPFDGVFDALPLSQWEQLSAREAPQYFTMLGERLTHEGKLTITDIKAMSELKMHDGTVLHVETGGDPPEIRLDGVKLRSVPAEWKGGVIFVMEGAPPAIDELLRTGTVRPSATRQGEEGQTNRPAGA